MTGQTEETYNEMFKNMQYVLGFIDALAIVEHYFLKYKDRRIFWQKLKEIKDAVKERRLELLRYELGLSVID